MHRQDFGVRLDRREFLRAATSTALVLPAFPAWARRRSINDYSGLDAVTVADERRPRSTDEVSTAVRQWPNAISVGGGRFSMGGQIAYPESLHLDMRQMNRVVSLDPERRTVRVQAGISWRDLQEVLDPYDLSASIMQSFSNFTVGGSVSVNCHGRYVGRGPIVNSVRGLQLVRADGSVLELAPSAEVFRGVFGGYGGLGVVTEVELDLEPNSRLRRVVEDVELTSYPTRFLDDVAGDSRVVLHNADLRPPDFDAPRMISWLATNRPATVDERLIPPDRNYSRNQAAIWAVSELPGGAHLRESVEERLRQEEMVVWRNYEASLDTDSLEPPTRLFSTYLLEYFIPVGQFLGFARSLAAILKAHKVNALNVSIRHSPADTRCLLSWAPTDVFSFVLYYKQRTTGRARRRAEVWTRQLIDAALEHGGRYYLPYRLHATPAQFVRAYPEYEAFRRLKARLDPHGKFRNMLWGKYLFSKPD